MTFDTRSAPEIIFNYAMTINPKVSGVGSAYFDRRFERLAKYAHDSGGDVYYGLKTKAMEELYSGVTEEARNQYTMPAARALMEKGERPNCRATGAFRKKRESPRRLLQTS